MPAALPSSQVEPATASAGRLRLLAVLLAGVQSLALGLVSAEWVFPVLAIPASLIALRSKRANAIDPGVAFRIVGIGVLLFMARYIIAPPQFPRDVLAVRTQLFHVVGQFLVAYQIAIIYFTPRQIRLPQRLPWMGVLAMLCTANVMVSQTQRWMFQTLSVVLILLLAAWTGMARPFLKQQTSSRNGRTIAIGICMVLTAVMTWVSATLLYQYENDLDDLISQFIQQKESVQETGFSGDGKLESVTRMHSSNENTVALRVDSDSPPDYMRGSAFVAYGSHNWLTPREHPRRLTPIDRPSDVSLDEDRGNIFSLRSISASQLKTFSQMECWPNPAGDGTIFSTVDSEFIQFNVEQAEINTADIIDGDKLPIGYPYRLFYGQADRIQQLPPNLEAQLTTSIVLPTGTATRQVARLAKSLFENSQSDEDRIAAVKQYFATYEYSESTQVPGRRDPIEWFLLDRPAGHCEFFASATVTLLRQAKIPSRYVTGFMITEQNLYGNYWVARNRDAHAWAEAWLPHQGWVVVETTPPDGIPEQSTPSTAQQLMEFLQSSLQTFRVKLSVGGIRWLGQSLLVILIKPITLLVIALVAVLLWLRRNNRVRKAGTSAAKPDQHVVRMNALLAKMDQRVAIAKLKRLPNETLHQFATRIESAESANANQPGRQEAEWAKWYRQYAAVRFGQPLDDTVIESLKSAIESTTAQSP